MAGPSRRTFCLPTWCAHLQPSAGCRDAEGELNPAGVGRGATQEVRETIRGDQIQWIDPGQAEACDQYLAAMDQLRLAINQGLFLGLEDFECHFALYPPGAFYHAAPGSFSRR